MRVRWDPSGPESMTGDGYIAGGVGGQGAVGTVGVDELLKVAEVSQSKVSDHVSTSSRFAQSLSSPPRLCYSESGPTR